MPRRLTSVAAAAAVALLLGAPPAMAHVELESSDPADGASLSTAPTRVSLSFTGPVAANSASVRITAPDGSPWRVSDVESSGPAVTAVVEQAGPAGVHGLSYRVTADDGHVLTGTIRFTLTPAAVVTTPTPTPTTTTTTTSAATTTAALQPEPAADVEDDGGLPAWFWVLFSAALVVGAAWLFRTKRR